MQYLQCIIKIYQQKLYLHEIRAFSLDLGLICLIKVLVFVKSILVLGLTENGDNLVAHILKPIIYNLQL